MNPEYLNISAYKFTSLEGLPELRRQLLDRANSLELKGTILLATEGVNMFVAGTRNAINDFLIFFRSFEPFQEFPVKESPSDEQPFSRMLVRIKKEIIAFGVDGVDPRIETSQKLSARELKQWLDEGKEVELLDVRNDYEVELGTFRDAKPIGVDHFRDFPSAVDRLPAQMKTRPLVMFCTGGIRCEKAGPLMQQRGFEEVYQLDGGILKYFEEVGGEHYDGECFVFDKRVAVDADLQETPTTQCYACQHPLTEIEQASEKYDPPNYCPYCFQTPVEKAHSLAAKRTKEIAAKVQQLPGSVPYDNYRPLNVPGRFDKYRLLDFLCELHPHVSRQTWSEKVSSGKILYKDAPVDTEFRLRAGMRLEHLLPASIEPDVSSNIHVLWEDDSIVVVNKPAPLPMHPGGRFNRNTLSWILDKIFKPLRLRIVHRLDANTTGLVIFAKKRRIASMMHDQFLAGRIRKTYLVRVRGTVNWDEHICRMPIGNAPGAMGVRAVNSGGQSAETQFKVVERSQLSCGAASTLMLAFPITGRTNQIRLHAWELGHPVVGDPVFLADREIGAKQTLSVDDASLQLNATWLQFSHPETGAEMNLVSRRPGWMNDREWSESFSAKPE